MTIEEIIRKRKICEVLHFTTHRGITGILATGHVLPRTQLPKDVYLEYVRLYNCPDRSRDKTWWEYVNLSLTDVNRYLLGIARNRWHSNDVGWWCVLSFVPAILTHDGVYFTTTNNAYPLVRHGEGADGLEAMFAPLVKEFDNKSVCRTPRAMLNMPTSPQAEVLYPKELDLIHLHHIYVPDEETAAKVESICTACRRDVVDCRINKELFLQ